MAEAIKRWPAVHWGRKVRAYFVRSAKRDRRARETL